MSGPSSVNGGIVKYLSYIGNLVKEDMKITFEDGSGYTFHPPDLVRLSSLIFMQDTCKMCGRCCTHYPMFYTAEELKLAENICEDDFTRWGLDYADKQLLFDSMLEIRADVNSNEVIFNGIILSRQEEKDNLIDVQGRKHFIACKWLKNFEDGTKRCRIYPCQTAPCKTPLVRISHFKDKDITETRILKTHPGRNFLVKCGVVFGSFNYEHYVNNDLKFFKRLKNIADNDLKIPTYLDELLNYLDLIDSSLQKGIIPAYSSMILASKYGKGAVFKGLI